MNVTRITLDRLYNLGNFEHQKYSISVDLAPDDSAELALIGLEKVMAALAPENHAGVQSHSELGRTQRRLDCLKTELVADTKEEFIRKNGWFEGTPQEYVARIEQALNEEKAKRLSYEARARQARAFLDKLGGAAEWKDHKLDWEQDE